MRVLMAMSVWPCVVSKSAVGRAAWCRKWAPRDRVVQDGRRGAVHVDDELEWCMGGGVQSTNTSLCSNDQGIFSIG